MQISKFQKLRLLARGEVWEHLLNSNHFPYFLLNVIIITTNCSLTCMVTIKSHQNPRIFCIPVNSALTPNTRQQWYVNNEILTFKSLDLLQIFQRIPNRWPFCSVYMFSLNLLIKFFLVNFDLLTLL